MRAEEVYNIAIHFPAKELARQYTLLETKVCKKQGRVCKQPEKKLIDDGQAGTLLAYLNLPPISLIYPNLPCLTPAFPLAHRIQCINFAS